MAQTTGNEQFQQWLAQINQECGNFAARPLEGEFSGHLETGYTRALKLSTVTTANVNLYRTRNELRITTTAGSTPSFSWKVRPLSNSTTGRR